jgi:uncharacterized protein
LIYLDASVLVSALTREPLSVSIRAWLQAQSNAPISLSGWTLLETASTISRKQRVGDLTAAQHQLALQLLEAVAAMNWQVLNVVSDDYNVARNWVGQPALSLRGGDALHLAITRRRGLVLATLDKGMAGVAEKLAIPCATLPKQ